MTTTKALVVLQPSQTKMIATALEQHSMTVLGESNRAGVRKFINDGFRAVIDTRFDSFTSFRKLTQPQAEAVSEWLSPVAEFQAAELEGMSRSGVVDHITNALLAMNRTQENLMLNINQKGEITWLAPMDYGTGLQAYRSSTESIAELRGQQARTITFRRVDEFFGDHYIFEGLPTKVMMGALGLGVLGMISSFGTVGSIIAGSLLALKLSLNLVRGRQHGYNQRKLEQINELLKTLGEDEGRLLPPGQGPYK